MYIGICNLNILGIRIKEILKIAKAQTINSSITSFSMVKFDIKHNEEKINIYALVPGIEDAQIIQIKNATEEKIYVVKDMMLSEISLETLFRLIQRDIMIEYWEKNDKSEELLEIVNNIPQELLEAYNLIGKVSCYDVSDKLDKVYDIFCNNIKEARNTRINYLEMIRKEEQKIKI